MKNRKAFIETVVKGVDEILPSKTMGKLYRQALENLSDEELEAYVDRLRNGISKTPDYTKPRELIHIVLPNMGKDKLNIDQLLSLADKWGVKLFERIWITDPITNDTYLTNRPYMIIDLPMSRQAQTLESKISVADDNRHIDDRTNQVTGVSKGASLSYPETQILLSSNLKKTVTELLKFRGGDETAFRSMNKSIIDTGTFDQAVFDDIDTRPKAVDTMSIYLKAMHLQNNL